MARVKNSVDTKPIWKANVPIKEVKKGQYTNFKGYLELPSGQTLLLDVSPVEKQLEDNKGRTITHFVRVAAFKTTKR